MVRLPIENKEKLLNGTQEFEDDMRHLPKEDIGTVSDENVSQMLTDLNDGEEVRTCVKPTRNLYHNRVLAGELHALL